MIQDISLIADGQRVKITIVGEDDDGDLVELHHSTDWPNLLEIASDMAFEAAQASRVSCKQIVQLKGDLYRLTQEGKSKPKGDVNADK